MKHFAPAANQAIRRAEDHYRIVTPPMTLVARFGSLLFALDDRGLHVRVAEARW